MTKDGRLTIAYTPDSDDAFYYYALETGRVPMLGYLPEFRCEPISALNQAARTGAYAVTAISSIAYPAVADRYAILSVGTSVGRGYGPVLVSRDRHSLDELGGCRVGVGGVPTTGWFLLRWLCPEATAVEMPFDRIADAVAAGELDAGVMIHEELLYYPKLGLHRIADLGAEWCRRTGLPLPVGLNVARRDLGRQTLKHVCTTIRRSLEYGLAHRQEALDWVSRFGRGTAGQCTGQFVQMFANEDSLNMPEDVREGLRVLLLEAADRGLTAAMPPLDIVEGTHLSAAPAREAA
jgi:1,4-dihydroxy-6-naphthoate synthase